MIGVEVNSTKSQIENFKESIIWQDIVRELTAWKEGFQIEQDCIVDNAEEGNPSTASILLHMGDLNGRKKAVDYMLQLPDIFLQLLEEKKDDARRKRTDRSEVG